MLRYRRLLCGVLRLACRYHAVQRPFVRILVEVARWSAGLRDASLLRASAPVQAFPVHLRAACVLAKIPDKQAKPRIGNRG